MLLGERHGERLALDDAVERELLALVGRVYADHLAQLLDDVLHHGRRLGVDHALRAAGEPGRGREEREEEENNLGKET